jgi:putative ABC transport system permease protein
MVGLMLSTLIIAASLTTGDTLDYSITSATYDGLGQTDETISFVAGTGSEGEVSVNNVPIDAAIADELEARFADDPDIAAVMPLLTVGAPVVNPDSGLSEPGAILTGVDPDRLDGFGGLQTPNGARIDLAGLPAGSVVISDDLADELDARPGDRLTFYFENQPHEVTVGAVAAGSILTGYQTSAGQAGPAQSSGIDLFGIAMPLAQVQELTGLAGQARFIAVSNTGGVEDGVERTDAAVTKLEQALAEIEGGAQLGVNPIKQDAVEGAETFGNVFLTLFILMGLFSIAAGILLIFLIFMMLAAERRSEMGMARAVGMTRSHLVQGFVAEGTAYDLGAALLGAALGVLVAFGIVGALGALLGDFVSITPHATWRSLLVAYALGVTVTFLTIMFASLRSSRLNIVAAIRDLPEERHASRSQRPRWRWWSRLPRFGPRVGVSLGSLLWFPLELVWNVGFVWLKAAIWLTRVVAHRVGWGPVIGALGGLGLLLGAAVQNYFTFSIGLSLLVLGLALFLRRFVAPRLVYTAAAAFMLLFWLLPFSVTERVLPELGEGGPEMFFVSGIFMVTYATLIIMWNADLIVGLVSLAGRAFSRWLPAVKTAVAYPLASKGRTGLTVAMFAMVVFSLVTVRTISVNFAELFTTDAADAGWDVAVTSNPSNPIDDLAQALAGTDVDPQDIGAIGRVDAVDFGNALVRNAGADAWQRYAISGMDTSYVDNAEIPLEARAPGYASDQAVWDAIRAGQPVAIVTSAAFESGGFGSDADAYTAPDDVEVSDGVLPAFDIELQSARTGTTQSVTVIGVIDAKVSTLSGFYLPGAVFDDLYGGPDRSTFYVQLADGAGAEDVAEQIEAALQTRGVQAESIQEQIDELQAFSNGFFTLLVGFMGLGLFVGIAALGVISFRSVVERRQQIGMLRAIGYRRTMVAASFLLESLVIAVLGVLSGATLAVILSYNLITSGEIDNSDFTGFVVPWTTIAGVIAASLVAAAVMTWIPARKASSVPIAEALRYE